MAERHTESQLMTPPASPLPEEEFQDFEEEEMHGIGYEDEHEDEYDDEYEQEEEEEYDIEYEEDKEYYDDHGYGTYKYSSRCTIEATFQLLFQLEQYFNDNKIDVSRRAQMLSTLELCRYDPDSDSYYLTRGPLLRPTESRSQRRRQSSLPPPPTRPSSYSSASETEEAEASLSTSASWLPQQGYFPRIPKGPPEYLQEAPYTAFPDEPKWHLFVPKNEEEEHAEQMDEDQKFMKYHEELLEDMEQDVEKEFRWYTTATKHMADIAQDQEPIIVSMVLVDRVQASTSATSSHGEGSSSGAETALELIATSTQEPPAAAAVNTPYESESSSQISSSADGADEFVGRDIEMSSIERALRAQAVTALNNPSALLLHAISMNETPSRTRLRMYRHLTGQPQPPHEYAPEAVKRAFRESGGRPQLDDSQIHTTHADSVHASPSSSSSSSSAAHATVTADHHQQHHRHHQHHSHSSSSHADDDAPMDDEFGPTYFQGALND
ncbi:MAG: hypothetical protein J3R72DRAFT_473793 [Linnemannia gamsii]|nr:MAG: hypothetical protein J3R72DRAFT_473793 [Linnemannia gamsii]